jgi:uncharacterized protein YciI
VIAYHAAIATADDYAARREPLRRAHLERLLDLRARGFVIAGGPAPDGRGVDVFYRARQPADLARLVEEDPYFSGGAWTGYAERSFAQFLEPWELPPLVADGSRRAMLVEGTAPDVEMASLALVEARGAGRLAFGGFFPGGATLAVMRLEEASAAMAALAETGLWEPGTLTARPWLYVL